MNTCEDCGTKLDGGICPNCSEALYIYINDYEYLPNYLSEEFTDKVKEQKKKKNTELNSNGTMEKIKLGKKDLFALCDDDDYEKLSLFKWYAIPSGRSIYAVMIRWNKETRKTENTYMHRMVMNPSKNQFVDHIDHDCLNNQKSNLRICTHRENIRNRRPMIGKYLGVYKNGNEKYNAYIHTDDKRIYLGRYSNEEDAALAYNNAAIKHYGEFANLNFK